MTTQGHLYVVSGPSGTGKTSLVNELAQSIKHLKVSLSYTTRPIRPNERNGVNYQFVTKEVFEAMIKEEAFLEHAKIFDNYYGTSRKWVKETLQSGLDVILEIDWQGAAQIKQQFPGLSSLFIIPPSRASLLERLKGRSQDSEAVIEQRMSALKEEMRHYEEYDYLICNQRYADALNHLKLIVEANNLRTLRQKKVLAPILAEFLS